MIIKRLNELNSKTLILASSSPRRKEIIQKLVIRKVPVTGIKIEIFPSTFEENLNPDNFNLPRDFVKETAKGKAKEVADRLELSNQPADLIISADTCVTLDGKVFGKPKDQHDAVNMLSNLSGRCHEVVTGVCMITRNRASVSRTVEFHETTAVTFASLNNELIKAYVDTGEPMDKAGAYGIQGIGGALIESINGDYYNVMGFPLHRFTCQVCSILDEWAQEPGSSGK